MRGNRRGPRRGTVGQVAGDAPPHLKGLVPSSGRKIDYSPQADVDARTSPPRQHGSVGGERNVPGVESRVRTGRGRRSVPRQVRQLGTERLQWERHTTGDPRCVSGSATSSNSSGSARQRVEHAPPRRPRPPPAGVEETSTGSPLARRATPWYCSQKTAIQGRL